LENVWHQNMKLLNQQAYFGQPAVGSTDLGNISQRLPVIQPFLSICPPEVSFHTPEFALATQSPQGTAAMLTAAKLLALTAVDYLASPSIQQAAALEFAQN
jgi:metal-dependent amidase/aminoacylase/carboxypeptidase family protein